MYHALIEALKGWNKANDRHAKLQHAYLTLAAVLLVTAGLASLVNYRLGQSILFLSGAAALVFLANAVVWALTDSFVLSRLQKRGIPPRKQSQ